MSATAASPMTGSTTTLMPQAKIGVGLFQVFDVMGTPRISPAAAEADAKRYGVIWGARPGMAPAWLAGNSSIIASYYFPQETDLSYSAWGAAGHNLAWWQTYHPDWILYSCTATGTPTKIPAYVGGLTTNIPLDFHNPSVVSYQVKAAAAYARANGYNALAADEVVFWNAGGAAAGSGAYACGIYEGSTFVRRYSSKTDTRWATDTVAWAQTAHSLAALEGLKFIVNHPAGNINSANEQTLLANVDADVDETGYSDYGKYTSTTSLFALTLNWVRYAQAHGVAPLIIDKYVQTTALSTTQIEHSIATYLMGNEGAEGLFAGNSTAYGVEQYNSLYATNFGTACEDAYQGTSPSPNVWYRRFTNALVVVNSGSSLSSEVATLPSGHTYRDLVGRAISNPLHVANFDAYVLLTTNGCN